MSDPNLAGLLIVLLLIESFAGLPLAIWFGYKIGRLPPRTTTVDPAAEQPREQVEIAAPQLAPPPHWTNSPRHQWHGMPGFGKPELVEYRRADYDQEMFCAGTGIPDWPDAGHRLLENQQVYLIPLTRTEDPDAVLLVCYDHGRPDAE